MAKLFIFSLGGTGARILRSTTMLLAAGVPAFNKFDAVFPILIDNDRDNGDGRLTMELLYMYDKINQLAFRNHPLAHRETHDSVVGQFFGVPLYDLQSTTRSPKNKVFNISNILCPPNPRMRFADAINYSRLPANSPTKLLVESLYNDANSFDPQSELYANLIIGFKGNANIGSVFQNKLIDTPEFKYFLRIYNPAVDKVVIAGSLFGGCGMSVMPAIVRIIKQNFHHPEIGVVLAQPYFLPKMVHGGAINPELFINKTNAAFSYLEESKLLDEAGVYIIGDPYPTVIDYCEGGPGQKNGDNVVELIGALSIANFAERIHTYGKRYSFSVDFCLTKGDTIYIDDFDMETKGKVFKYIADFAYSVKYYYDGILSGKYDRAAYFRALRLQEYLRMGLSKNGERSTQDMLYHFERFIYQFKGWANELNSNDKSHRLSMFNFHNNIDDMISYRSHEAEMDRSHLYRLFHRSPMSDMTSQMDLFLREMDFYHLDDKSKNDNSAFAFLNIIHAASRYITTKYSEL